MSEAVCWLNASGYQDDPLNLPVVDLDEVVQWYGKCFGLTEVRRTSEPLPQVVMERDGVPLGFTINGGDAGQDGAAIEVRNIEAWRHELEQKGVNVSPFREDQRDGNTLKVFFVIAPDGLCYYMYQPVT